MDNGGQPEGMRWVRRSDGARPRLADLGDRVERILRLAEEQARAHREEAEREAEQILAQARSQAQAILDQARAEATRMSEPGA
jgi:cell division septum initiation protein DivIVA